MTSHLLTFHEPDLLQRSAACPRRSAFETAAGSLILRSFCPPSLVTSLKADRGLRAFARVPEREHQLLLGIEERSEEHTSELQSRLHLVCRLLLEKKKNRTPYY